MKSVRSLLGIFGFRTPSSPSLSRVVFRQDSRTRFIGRGSTSPRAGYIDSSQRGVWTLTEKGRSLEEVTPNEIQRIIREVSEQTKPTSGGGLGPGGGPGDTVPIVSDYREELARTLQSLPAAGFERFCQRLLRESGFQEVTITGRSGDGGLDGIGILQVNALVSFKVLFQCKKYAGRSRQVTFAISAAQ
jgi:restriction system protein